MDTVVVVRAWLRLVKAAFASRALAADCGVSEVIVHIGQHRAPEMSETFSRELELPEPAYTISASTAP